MLPKMTSIALSLLLPLSISCGSSSTKKAVETQFGGEAPPSAPIDTTPAEEATSPSETPAALPDLAAPLTDEATPAHALDALWGDVTLPVQLSNGKLAELRVQIRFETERSILTSYATYIMGIERVEVGTVELESPVKFGETTIEILTSETKTIDSSEGPLSFALDPAKISFELKGEELTLIYAEMGNIKQVLKKIN